MAFKKNLRKVDSAYVGLRDPFLKSISKNKSVLHVGCTDFPFAEDSVNNNTLLHKKLSDETTMLVGIDIDKRGLVYLEKELPGLYLYGDLCNPDVREKLFQYEFDLILVPDVIEHVPNQFTFIEGLLALALSLQAELIITTPNQYSFKAMLAALAGLDYTHTDHRLIHNLTTLRTAIVHDFNVSDTNFQVDYASRDIKARYGNFMSAVSKIFDKFFYVTPYLADTIVVTLKPKIK
jgi:2-polyprenyl-3-methyl-5-hydroxy-6-metoxy-1,4-benzoquinol methylase